MTAVHRSSLKRECGGLPRWQDQSQVIFVGPGFKIKTTTPGRRPVICGSRDLAERFLTLIEVHSEILNCPISDSRLVLFWSREHDTINECDRVLGLIIKVYPAAHLARVMSILTINAFYSSTSGFHIYTSQLFKSYLVFS